MATLLPRAKSPLDVNLSHEVNERLTENGSNWLFAVTAVFFVVMLALSALQLRARAGERLFHYIFIIANFVGGIAYFAMASNLAWHARDVILNHDWHSPPRQVFWAKYAYWAVSFPAVILALGVLSGVAWATIVYHMLLAWIWIGCYYGAAFVDTSYRWAFFVFGTVAWLMLAASTLLQGTRSARRVGIARDYTALAGWVNLLWLLYPIAWGLSEGGNRLGVTGAMAFFGVLDLLMVPVLSAAFVVLARRWDYHRLNIAFTQYGRVPAAIGTFPDKHHTTAGGAGVAPARAV